MRVRLWPVFGLVLTAGADSIQYYYQRGDPYKHGLMIVPGQQPPIPLDCDLAMRVYGQMDAVGPHGRESAGQA